MTHWADVAAADLVTRVGAGKALFATAITPSGPIHVGNMREVLTTEAVFRAARDAGADCELLYIADDYDPLRKEYSFLQGNEAGVEYGAHVGRPLRELPCPCGDHPHYAAHYLEPFLGGLPELGIVPTVHSAYDLYQEGRYREAILAALDRTDALRDILEEVTKRQLPKVWLPFNAQCPACGRIAGTQPIAYERPRLTARCDACAAGSEGAAAGDDGAQAGVFTVDVTAPGAGKLPWRIDWPARWRFLDVSFEAFGKDHGAAGGSWDSGVRIVREVFGGAEPQHIMYEFLHLKGKGAMHSSTGLAVGAHEVLRMTPPEVLRYLLMRQSPRKHIDFDPGLGLLSLVDEFDRLERVRFGAEENPGTFTEVERTYGLSMPHGAPGRLPHRVSVHHLVTVCQMADSVAGVEAVLKRSGELPTDFSEADRSLLAERVAHVRYWLDHFAPQEVRFRVQESLPPHPFTADDKAFMAALADALAKVQWNGQAIHDAVYEAKGERTPRDAFRALYQAILGQDRGPRAGFFLASLERDWVVARLEEAAG